MTNQDNKHENIKQNTQLLNFHFNFRPLALGLILNPSI
ncbi:hypothetical protein Gogos_000017 [Gossypium gossypioides]|uniref:Uncharacterized protein n=1 Tax=Gossypium gossypioides TaxID=34282 RepID=A0A7J9CZ63_GOSGO|nr:hypothetical protein [Gossypium gossypioides]